MKRQNWYALWVKSHQEFVTARELNEKGIENFLPAVTRVRQWKDRKKSVDFPLFPGYLFVHVPPRADAFLNVVKTRGSVALVALEPGRPTPVSPEEIESLKIVLRSGAKLELYPALQEGTPVRITRGPLSGAVGVLTTRPDEHRFAVNVDILGRSLGVNIYAEDLETI